MLRARAAAVLLCAALAACSGGSGGGQAVRSPSPTGMARSDYVSAVNAVCKKVGEQAEAIPEPTTAQGYVETLTNLIAILEDGQRELRALEPPAADKAEVEQKFLRGSDEQAKVLRDALPDVRKAAGMRDKAGAEAEFVLAFEKFGAIAQRDEQWASDYGLTECV